MSSLEIRVCGRYRIDDKLFQGKYCSVYTGKNVHPDIDCAIKCEPKTISPSFTLNQGKVLEALQGGVGIPHLLWFGENGDFRFVITQLLGNSLEEYLDICGGVFSLKTTLMIAERILSSIEFIHYKNFVHRDIKPENFLMGLGKKLHQIYTIDLAFAAMYLDPKNKELRPNITNQQSFVGTLHFASMNTLKGNTYSRRDDLESIGLMLVYFLKGSLPWSNVNGESIKEVRKNIIKIRESLNNSKLCENLPKEFQTFFEYLSSLKYDDIPDYNYLRRLLKEKFIKEGYQFDYIYDWILIPIRGRDHDLTNRIPLNRTTKKDNGAYIMCNNMNYDFGADFRILEQKIEENNMKAQQKQELIPQRQKRSVTTLDKKPPPKPTQEQHGSKGKGKGNKDDCHIF